MKKVVLLTLLLLVADCSSNRDGETDTYDFSPRERAAVNRLLQDSTGWRLALPSDHEGNKALQKMQEAEPGYEPFTARGDFDRDGQEDLVVTLVKDGEYSVYLIRPQKGRSHEAHWFATADWLDEEGIFTRGHQVGVGNFFSDVVHWFKWSSEREEMMPVESDVAE